MTEIQRYQFYPQQKDKVQECQTGFWVKHDDHIKAIQFWKEKCEFAQNDSKSRIKDQVKLNDTIEEQAKEIKQLEAENKQLSDELADRAVTAVRKMRNSPWGYNI